MTRLLSVPHASPGQLTVGDVAAEAGVAPSAVRFYERHGLITATRTATNQRRFTGAAPCLIKVAKVAQRVGLSVREIAELFSTLPEQPQCQDWVQVTATLVGQAQERVDALHVTLAELGSGSKLCDAT